MDYMLDKINLLKNKDNIINTAYQIAKSLEDNKNLDDSEKLMTIELAVAIPIFINISKYFDIFFYKKNCNLSINNQFIIYERKWLNDLSRL